VDEVWCYTSFIRDAYLAGGVPEHRLRVVPLGVDADRFAPDGPRFEALPAAATRFLFVGGTIARKGIDVLLEAWVRAFTAADDVALVVKGSLSDGAYLGSAIHQRLERLRAEHPDAAPIEYLDTDLAAGGIAALYRSCDALVLPYRGEGFGLPIVEAMASGLAVVAPGAGAAADFLADDRAFLIPSTRTPLAGAAAAALPPAGPAGYWLHEPDRDGLVEHLRTVHRDRAEARRRADAGRAWVREHLTWDRAAAIATERLVDLAATPCRPASGPLLSACLIVKDEEAMLPDCLASLAGVVDEIVVHDTGSTDATVAIARAAGATVVEGRWSDDFAAARNVALDACRGRWVLHIDADERLTGDGAALRAHLRRTDTPATLLVGIDNLRDGGEVGIRHDAIRLFERRRAHWVGRLHEQVVPREGGAPLPRGRTDAVRLTHLGYARDVVADRGKAERNVRLAEADLAHAGHDDRALLLLNLARSLTVAGDLDAALERCAEARVAATGSEATRLANLHHGIEVLFSLGRPADALGWIDELRDRRPAGDRLVAFLDGTARLLLGEDAPGLLALVDDDVWNEAVGLAVSADLVRHRRALALAGAGRWDDARPLLLQLAADHPELPIWSPLVRSGAPAAEVAALVPDDRLRAVLAQLLLVDAGPADAVGNALWSRFPGDPRLVAFGVHHGPRCAAASCLEWGARVRGAGLVDRCPLLRRAARDDVGAVERVRAAAIAHAAFADPRALDALAAALDAVDPADAPLALAELEALAPDLLLAISSTAS
jgi:tetratricopeptide (TPR) repeat protein